MNCESLVLQEGGDQLLVKPTMETLVFVRPPFVEKKIDFRNPNFYLLPTMEQLEKGEVKKVHWEGGVYQFQSEDVKNASLPIEGVLYRKGEVFAWGVILKQHTPFPLIEKKDVVTKMDGQDFSSFVKHALQNAPVQHSLLPGQFEALVQETIAGLPPHSWEEKVFETPQIPKPMHILRKKDKRLNKKRRK